jgi:hypothetical protein
MTFPRRIFFIEYLDGTAINLLIGLTTVVVLIVAFWRAGSSAKVHSGPRRRGAKPDCRHVQLAVPEQRIFPSGPEPQREGERAEHPAGAAV